MYRFIENKFSKDPETYGSLLSGYKKCGKKNCRCSTKNEPHKYYYLKWRDLDPFTRTHKVHKRYVKKDDFVRIRGKLADAKGVYIWGRLPYDMQNKFLERFMGICNSKNIYQYVYEIFKKADNPYFS